MRLRVVQPPFWDDDRIGGVSWDARLLLIGLWSYVRDEGVGKDQLGAIIGTLFPHDSEKDHEGTRGRVAEALDELCAVGLVIRFEAEGVKYIEIERWSDWQKPDKPSKARYPLSTSVNAKPLGTPSGVSRNARGTLPERSSEFESRSSKVGVRKSDIGIGAQRLEEESEEPPLPHDDLMRDSRNASADAAATQSKMTNDWNPSEHVLSDVIKYLTEDRQWIARQTILFRAERSGTDSNAWDEEWRTFLIEANAGRRVAS